MKQRLTFKLPHRDAVVRTAGKHQRTTGMAEAVKNREHLLLVLLS